jgi:hypothetical protein
MDPYRSRGETLSLQELAPDIYEVWLQRSPLFPKLMARAVRDETQQTVAQEVRQRVCKEVRPIESSQAPL